MVTADLPDLPLTGVVKGIIALIPARGIIDPTAVPGIILESVLRDAARGIIRVTVAQGIIAVSLFLLTADRKGAVTAKEGQFSPGETHRECSMIIT